MRKTRPLQSLLLVVVCAGLASCNVFDPRSSDLSCAAPTDCSADRTCESGFCVVRPGFLPDADPNLPDAVPAIDADPNAPDANSPPDGSVPAPDAAPCTPIAIVDDFADGLAAPLWVNNGTAEVTIVEAGGVLTINNGVLPGAPATVNYSSLLRNYDMTGRYFAIEVPTMLNTASKANANLTIGVSGPSQLEFRQKTGALSITLFDGGTTVLATLTYNAVAHRWWRVLDSGGTTLAQTSPDGVVWTTQGSVATPSFFAAVGVNLEMRAFSTGEIPGDLVFDNANLGVTCP